MLGILAEPNSSVTLFPFATDMTPVFRMVSANFHRLPLSFETVSPDLLFLPTIS